MHPKTPFSVDLEETIQQLGQLNGTDGIRNDGDSGVQSDPVRGYLLPGGIGEGQRTAGVGKRGEIQMEISVRQGEQQAEASCRFRQGKAVCRVAVHAGADQTVERGADVGGEDIESARLCNNIKPIRGRGDRKRIIIVIYLDTDIIRCGFKGKTLALRAKTLAFSLLSRKLKLLPA